MTPAQLRMAPALVCFGLVCLPAPRGKAAEPTAAAIETAVRRALPLLQTASQTFRERSEGRCIGCHHQGLILQTVALARKYGYPCDEGLAREERERVHGFYRRRQNLYREALADPAAAQRADSYGNFTVHVGYWLWGLSAEQAPPDEVLATTARLLATKQTARGSWTFTDVARAPMQSGEFITTALAVRVLRDYGPATDTSTWQKQIAAAGRWLSEQTPRTTDDQTFRILGLRWADQSPELIRSGTDRLLAEQREDGSWAQQANMPGDAYSTGQVLVVLHQVSGLAPTDPAYRRGLEYLLRKQEDDGSWFVKTRAVPSNPYFESGFPHAKSQFISYAASCWATQALILATPRLAGSQPGATRP